MKTEVIATRGHTIDLSEEWAALGHISPLIEGVIVSRDLISFSITLEIKDNDEFATDLSNEVKTSYDMLTTTRWRAQQFIPEYDGQLVKISLQIYKNGTPTQPMFIEIYATDINCKPVGPALAQIQIDASNPNVPTQKDIWTDWNFISPPTVTKDVIYHILLRSLEVDPNYFWRMTQGEPDGETTCGNHLCRTTNGGTTWYFMWYYRMQYKAWLQSNITKAVTESFALSYIDELQFIFEENIVVDDNLILDQSCMEEPDGGTNDIYYDQWYGQQFVPSVTGSISFVKLGVVRDDYPDLITDYPLMVDIYEVDINGWPTGSSLSHGEVLEKDILPFYDFFENDQSPSWVNVEMPPVILTSGTKYVLVLSSYNPIENVMWVVPATYPSICYPAGIAVESDNRGASWYNVTTIDYRFQEFLGYIKAERVVEFDLELINEEEP